MLCQVLNARGDITGEAADRLRQVSQLFGVEADPSVAPEAKAQIARPEHNARDAESQIRSLDQSRQAGLGGAGQPWCTHATRVRSAVSFRPRQNGLLIPVLVGPAQRIKAVAREHDLDIGSFELIDVAHSEAAAAKAVQLIHEGKAELLMKGSLHTDELMRAVTASATGLRTARRISHVFIMDVPTYPETLFITDAAINIAPDLDAKRDIVQNTIDLFVQVGLGTPRVAILSAVETVTTKIPSTIEAAALCKMAERGQITGGVLDGPLAFDNAIDPEAAEIKGIRSAVAGRAQILIVPDLEAGNMLAKNLTFMLKADAAGLVLGARVPIVLTSRADSVRTRLASCAAAVLYADARRRTSNLHAGVTIMDTILVVNSGSSSLKFQVFEIAGPATLKRLVKGQLDGIGTQPRLRVKGSDDAILIDRTYAPEAVGTFRQRSAWQRRGSRKHKISRRLRWAIAWSMAALTMTGPCWSTIRSSPISHA